jgi:hypothetical protein
MNIHTSYICMIALFDGAFKYGDVAKFWSYIGTNAEPICAAFYNFGQCHIFVNYLLDK